jgi:hypothetical protein
MAGTGRRTWTVSGSSSSDALRRWRLWRGAAVAAQQAAAARALWRRRRVRERAAGLGGGTDVAASFGERRRGAVEGSGERRRGALGHGGGG